MERCAAFIVLALILLVSAAAQNESDIFSSSPDMAGITPPGVPREAGVTRAAAGGALASASAAPEDFPVDLALVDARDGRKIGNVHVIVAMRNATGEARMLAYVGGLGVLHMHAGKGAISLVLKADDIATSGGDYYGTKDLTIDHEVNDTALLFPVGSVKGKVTSDGDLVAGARMSADCSGVYGDLGLARTDEFGSFSAQWLPLGTCTIHASDGKRAGMATVEIRQGTLQDVEIGLKTRISSYNAIVLYLAIGLAFIILLLLLIVHLNVRRKRQPRPQAVRHARLSDILTTLSQKERQVVELLEKEGAVSQAKVIYSLMIPKTTLVRLLQNLEAKHVIMVERHGKAKKVSLTEWVLEKK